MATTKTAGPKELTDLVYTVPEASGMAKVSESHLWNLIWAGTLPTVRIGRRVLIPRDALADLLSGKAQR